MIAALLQIVAANNIDMYVFLARYLVSQPFLTRFMQRDTSSLRRLAQKSRSQRLLTRNEQTPRSSSHRTV